GVIGDPGDQACGDGEPDERALPDQFSSAGERTVTAMVASTERRPVARVSTSIRNRSMYAVPGGASRSHAVRKGAVPAPEEASGRPASPSRSVQDRTATSRSPAKARSQRMSGRPRSTSTIARGGHAGRSYTQGQSGRAGGENS